MEKPRPAKGARVLRDPLRRKQGSSRSRRAPRIRRSPRPSQERQGKRAGLPETSVVPVPARVLEGDAPVAEGKIRCRRCSRPFRPVQTISGRNTNTICSEICAWEEIKEKAGMT